MEKVKNFIKTIKVTSITEINSSNGNKINKLIEFADKNAFKVKEVIVPSREERNAR